MAETICYLWDLGDLDLGDGDLDLGDRDFDLGDAVRRGMLEGLVTFCASRSSQSIGAVSPHFMCTLGSTNDHQGKISGRYETQAKLGYSRETTIIAFETGFPSQSLRAKIALAPCAQGTSKQQIERTPCARLH